MASHDLTATMMKYLDRHQILPLLEFLQDKKLFNSKDLQKAKYDLVSKTKMVDYAIEEYKALNGTEEVPGGMEEQRTTVYNEISTLQEACGALLKILHTEDDNVEDRPSLEALKQQGVTPSNIAALYPYAKLNFDCGSYGLAAKTLEYFRLLSDDDDLKFWALWGKLAAEILMVNCEVANEDMKQLRSEIDRRVLTDHMEQLQQRTWLIHWSLFIFFNLDGGLSNMMEFMFQEKIVNAIQTNCPHILRYIVTAVIVNKSRKNVVKDVIRILLSEKLAYQDPLTELLLATCSDFDFTKTQALLKQCKEVVESDFFLNQNGDESQIAEQFMDGARLLVFETCCRIHSRISIDDMAGYLDLDVKEAEHEIMKLIREGNVDANIDSEKRQVVVSMQERSVYQMVINQTKSKNLDNRSNQLIQQVEKKLAMRDDPRD